MKHSSTCLLYGSGSLHVMIDNELLPIIQLCWANGVRTQGCCQDTGGEAYINFADHESAVRFLCLIGTRLTYNIGAGGVLSLMPHVGHRLEWQMYPVSDGRGGQQFAYSVNFDKELISAVFEALIKNAEATVGAVVCETHN